MSTAGGTPMSAVPPAAASGQLFLRIGDLIFLTEEGDGCVGGQGFTDSSLGVYNQGELPPLFTHRCIFTVRQQHDHTVAKQIRSLAETEGLSLHELEADGRLRRLNEARERERAHNQKEFQQMIGRTVRYGNVIELQHTTSQKFVSVLRHSAEQNKEARKVALDREAGEWGWFRIVPRLRVHSEGDRVRIGDPFLLEHVSTNLKLHADRVGRLSDGRREVNGTSDASTFKLLLYRSCDDNKQKTCPVGGQPVRLIQKEAEAYLGCDLARATQGLPAYLISSRSHLPSSSNTMWELHNAEMQDGSMCKWGSLCRLVHVGVGRMLAVVPAQPESAPAAASGAMSPRKASDTDAETAQDFKVVLVPVSSTSETLFELVPQYPTQDVHVRLDQFFRIRHVGTGWWLHFAGLQDAVDDEDFDASDALKAASTAMTSAGATKSAQLTMLSEEEDQEHLSLVASAIPHDEDVFGLQTLPAGAFDDVTYSRCLVEKLRIFVEKMPETEAALKRLDLRAVTRTIGELIIFVTISDIVDPLRREGLPNASRQAILREQAVIDLAMQCVLRIFRSVSESGHLPHFARGNDTRRKAGLLGLHRLATLCQHLVRHTLRDNAASKQHAMQFVESLQELLGCGIDAALTLTEVFVDNEAQLVKVTDAHIQRFIQLMRGPGGRSARFVDFLVVLCQCDGRAVRTNQWRVCELLLNQAPELLLSLSMEGRPNNRNVYVTGDAKCFPEFGAVSMGRMELTQWLNSTTQANAEYFERQVALMALLVRGRNMKNTEVVRRLLPYELVLSLVTSKQLHRAHLLVSAQFAAVARELYVDHVPHEIMAEVKNVRLWEEVQTVADSGQMSGRCTTVINVNWSRFDELKSFILQYVSHFFEQNATQLQENTMVLELLKLLHSLLELGFYTAAEVGRILPQLLKLLDGRADVVGLHDDEVPGERYQQIVTVRVDTLVIMECKLWLCKILQLVTAIRLDIRLSMLLAHFASEWDAGVWSRQKPDGEHTVAKAVVDRANDVAEALSEALGRDPHTPYQPLEEKSHKSVFEPVSPMKLQHDRKACVDAMMELLNFDGVPDLVDILMDLTFYKHKSLVSESFSLLVRHSEQARALCGTALGVQLLVKPSMVQRYSMFDELLRQLGQLAEKRALYDEELYQAAYVLGQLTMNLYEESEPVGPGAKSAAGRSVLSRVAPSGAASAALSRAAAQTDPTEGMYSLLVGKAMAHIGSDQITFTERPASLVKPGEKLEIVGSIYTVRAMHNEKGTLTLDRPLKIQPPHGHDRPVVPPELRRGRGEVWVFQLNQSAGTNLDMQVLLRNMGAHHLALKMLRLPVTRDAKPKQLKTRDVVTAVYRLLKAMVNDFPLMQNDLVSSVPTFINHIDCRLVGYDISPTAVINAVFKDNRSACAQVSDDIIKLFVNLAADEQAPRFLRFLRGVTTPRGAAIRRNQLVVAQALSDKEAALVLFNSPEEQAERDELIRANDHIVNPKGKLVYHMELIGLLCQCAIGSDNAPAELVVRDLVPLPDLLSHLIIQTLPLPLRSNYLWLLNEAYFNTQKSVRDLVNSDELPEMLEEMLRMIRNLVEDVLPFANFLEEEEEAALAAFVCDSVLPALHLYYERHFQSGTAADELRQTSVDIGEQLLKLREESAGQEQFIPHDAVDGCLRAMAARGLVTLPPSASDEAEAELLALKKAEVSLPEREEHPQEALPDFVDKIRTILNPKDDFLELVSVFTDGIDERPARRGAVGVPSLPTDSVGFRNTRNLVVQLLEARRTPRDPVGGRRQRKELLQSSMRVLVEMLNLPGESDAPKLAARQKLLVSLDAHKLAVVMAACEDDHFCHLGVRLGIGLLARGNKEAQDAIFNSFIQQHTDSLSAFDGSGYTMLVQMKQRLRRGAKEIAERKLYVQQQAERRAVFDEETADLNASTVLAMRADLEREFASTAFVTEVLEVLRLLCEGHHTQLQDYLRDPIYEAANVDLVSEVASLLQALAGELDGNNVDQALKALETLIEFVQGNVSQGNASQLLDSKLLEVLDRMVCMSDDDGDDEADGDLVKVPEDTTSELRLLSATLLMALAEGGSISAEERMLQVLDLSRVAGVAGACFTASTQLSTSVFDGKKSRAETLAKQTSLLNAAYGLYILVSHLLDYETEQAVEGGATLRESVYEALGAEARQEMQQYVGRAEIMNAGGDLERVYFRFPDFCLLLTEETKQELLWGVDRDTPGKQLQEFFAWSEEMRNEMKHQALLRKYQIWRVIMRNKSVADNLVLSLAALQNVVLMLRFSTPDADPMSTTYHEASYHELLRVSSNVMGVLQCVACVVVFTIYAAQSSPLRVKRLWREETHMLYSELLKRTRNSLKWRLYWLVKTPYFALTDAQLVLHGLFILAAILGLFVSPFWFSVHLLDLVNKSSDLKAVFKAVTLNGRSIVVTALFGFVLIYLYAIVGYVFAPNEFILDNYPDEDVPMCTSLLVCWVSAINEGLRSGDIGSIMDPVTPDDVLAFTFRFLFSFTFWVAVVTVLLNVIFGIIIDTFGELRTVHAGKKANMENICFVCGLDRFTLDTKGRGFDRHIKEDHNMWVYLFLLVHLREKDPTEYNGWEEFVAKKVALDDTTFLPRHTALVLKESQDREDQESHQLAQQLTNLTQTVDSVSHTVRLIAAGSERLFSLEQHVAGLQRSFDSLITTPAARATVDAAAARATVDAGSVYGSACGSVCSSVCGTGAGGACPAALRPTLPVLSAESIAEGSPH